MSPLKKKDKTPGKLGSLFAVGSAVALSPVVYRRYKDAKRAGDKLAAVDAVVSAAALLVGVLKVTRARKYETVPADTGEKSGSGS